MILKTADEVKAVLKKEGSLQIFNYKGFTCFIRRLLTVQDYDKIEKYTIFHLCGYVGIPKWHKLYKKESDDLNISCHGGITFTGFLGENKDLWFIAFDCGHAGDQSSLVNLIRNGEYRNIKYVKDQIKGMVDQIVTLEDVDKMKAELDQVKEQIVEGAI